MIQKSLVAAFLTTIVLCARASAQGRFEFIADEDPGIGAVALATLELNDTDTANHENVVEFFFSPEGDEIFRLGQDYPGTV